MSRRPAGSFNGGRSTMAENGARSRGFMIQLRIGDARLASIIQPRQTNIRDSPLTRSKVCGSSALAAPKYVHAKKGFRIDLFEARPAPQIGGVRIVRILGAIAPGSIAVEVEAEEFEIERRQHVGNLVERESTFGRVEEQIAAGVEIVDVSAARQRRQLRPLLAPQDAAAE